MENRFYKLANAMNKISSRYRAPLQNTHIAEQGIFPYEDNNIESSYNENAIIDSWHKKSQQADLAFEVCSISYNISSINMNLKYCTTVIVTFGLFAVCLFFFCLFALFKNKFQLNLHQNCELPVQHTIIPSSYLFEAISVFP